MADLRIAHTADLGAETLAAGRALLYDVFDDMTDDDWEHSLGGMHALVFEGYLGAGIGNLINLFNPERVVLGGWAGLALGAVSLSAIRTSAQAQAQAQPYGQVSIELSDLGPDAAAFGAATLPLAALLNRGEDPRQKLRRTGAATNSQTRSAGVRAGLSGRQPARR